MKAVNQYRHTLGRTNDLTESPGHRMLNYSKETSGTTGLSTGKEGYWGQRQDAHPD
jgi:hypothetical protein